MKIFFTHFFCESYHAIDFKCDTGTPLVALDDGVVREIIEHNSLTGIHCRNLGVWNSISVDIVKGPNAGYTFEYVHIAPSSATVSVGQTVKRGNILCQSGTVGFSPEPHVHIEVHRTADLKGQSQYFRFNSNSGISYVPIAGKKYTKNGLCIEK